VHSFDELVTGCTEFTLNALRDAQDRIERAFETSGATALVRAAQAVQLQKAIAAVGMFSMFDAQLQTALRVRSGFSEAHRMLEESGSLELKQRFSEFEAAVNVLKHGSGRSYDELTQRAHALPFRIKIPGEHFFEEGDVSEVNTLVRVDDQFVRDCAELIAAVAAAVREASSDAP
jgi:hypothetical protein